MAYHAMDYLTWLCPPARRLISRKFGMQVVENRKGQMDRNRCIQEQEENGQG